jgi:hypothetical protein
MVQDHIESSTTNLLSKINHASEDRRTSLLQIALVGAMSDSRRVAARLLQQALGQPTPLETNFSMLLRSERPLAAVLSSTS